MMSIHFIQASFYFFCDIHSEGFLYHTESY